MNAIHAIARSGEKQGLSRRHFLAVCHLANLSLRTGRKIRWDADQEEILGDAEAARMLERPYRKPWDAELKALRSGGTRRDR